VSSTPLVTIAIPSYKPRHFEAALLSALAQSYTALEILVSDDCPTDAIQRIVQRHASHSRRDIRVIHNRPGLGGLMNYTQCVVEARGEFVKFLNDDDVLLVDCVERMVEVFHSHPDVSLVTSRRILIDTAGVPLPDILPTCNPFDEDTIVQGGDLTAFLVDEPMNFIGEPSTVMFRRQHLADVKPNISCLDGQTVRAINDLAMYANVLRHGNLAYLCEPLSCFRMHAEQRQQQGDMQELFRQYVQVFTSQIHAMGLYRPQADGQVRWRPLAAAVDDWSLLPLRQRFREAGVRLALEQQRLAAACTPAHIHQIFYSEETRKLLEPGFIPLDNVGQRPDWAEYWPMRNLLLNAELDENAFYGVLSPRFRQKTGLGAKQVFDFVASAPDDTDVLLFPMFFDEGALFESVFIQGLAYHPNIWPAFVEMARQLTPGVNLETLVMDAQQSQFCNYFIAKPRFWRHWFSRAETIFQAAEQSRGAARPTPYGMALNIPTLHRGVDGYECKVFVMERLLPLILATDAQWKVQAYAPLNLPKMRADAVIADFIQLNQLKTCLREADTAENRAAYEVLREKVYRATFAEKIAEKGGHVPPLAEQIKAAVRQYPLLPVPTDIAAWLDERVPSQAESALIAEHLAANTAPTFGVLVLDREGDAQRVAATLRSLSQEHCLYAGLSVTVLTVQDPLEVTTQQSNVNVLPIGEHPLPVIEQVVYDGDFDWFMLVDAGSEFTASGLLIAALDLMGAPGLRAVYGDEVGRSGANGLGLALRPDLNLDMLLSLPSVMAGHWLFNRETWQALGGFRAGAGRAFELDFILHLIEDKGFEGLGHISEPLLISEGRPIGNCDDECNVIRRHLAVRGFENATVKTRLPGHYDLDYGAGEVAQVSILVSTEGGLGRARRCTETILEKTAYRAYEILLLDQGGEDPDLQGWLEGIEQLGTDIIRVLRFPAGPSLAQVRNQAAQHARGELLLWLDAGIAVLDADWLHQLVNHASRQEVGAVGAKLLGGDCTVRHGGVILGLNGPVGRVFGGHSMDATGYLQRLFVDQNHTAISGKCLMLAKRLFLEAGGFDESSEMAPWADTDLSLRLHQAGYLNVWTPRASLLINEAPEPSATIEQEDAMYSRWLPLLARDPAYNPNFALEGGEEFHVSPSMLSWNPLSSWRPTPVVLAYAADQRSAGQHRVIQPLAALEQAGLVKGAVLHAPLSVAELERYAPDSIVLQRQVTDDQLERMRRMQAFSRAFKVFELDDYLPGVPKDSVYGSQMPEDIVRNLRRGLSYVDRLVVATEPLAEAFVGLHERIQVVPNRLNPRVWRGLGGLRGTGVKPRVGWVSEGNCIEDLAIIFDVVKELAGEVEWVFMGMRPDELRPYIHEYHPGVPAAYYPAKLAQLNLDLALVPLKQSLFNDCRSNARLLEYGACGVPIICSDLLCHQGDLLVTRVKNGFESWVDAIRMHLADPQASGYLGNELRAQVLRDWMLEGDNLQQWRQAWLSD
jgi:GT2 family glycosyltransferase/glycosyltransferase involved in cell wall biosynthesis